MLLKNNGFFLLELLLSLSAWFMIGLFFVPLLVDITNQTKQSEVNTKAQQLLFGELQAELNNGHSYSSFSIWHNGVEYKINWSESAIPGKMEVCVRVDKNHFLSKTEICKKPE